MKVRHLNDDDFDILLECFLKSFANYFVTIPTDREYFIHRWKAAKVRMLHSYAMFDSEKMVGFIIHAIDKRNGRLVAFNTGTGVLPEYRGKGITKTIYDFAQNELQENGIEVCQLEVITDNKIAIQVYEKIGFKISRNFLCFNGTLNIDLPEKISVYEIDNYDFDWDIAPDQGYYSWDHQKEVITNDPEFKFYHVFEENFPIGFFILKPDIGYLGQCSCFNDHNWPKLLAGIAQVTKGIKINNVDHRRTPLIESLERYGLENFTNQYEMKLSLI